MSALHQSDAQKPRYIGDNQRYRLEQRLGQGGMGEVYLAMDTLLGKQVALKLLKPNYASTEAICKRFKREVSLCAALQSQNIVQVSDYGLTAEGIPFYVMEYLVGQTLKQVLDREKRLTVSRSVAIATQVCAGLQLAHQGIVLQRQGQAVERVKVVHRDLKPENIFLVPTALGELVKILDFGIAQIRDAQSELTNLHTSQFVGTFHYASPEQFDIAGNLDARADIYSLGMILYEMLSGTDPFGFGEKVNKTTALSWIKAHVTMTPLSLRSQVGCNQLSPALEQVVMCCLCKQPHERFDTIDALSQALQAAIAQKPPLPPVSLPEAINSTTVVGQPLTIAVEQSVSHPTLPSPSLITNIAPPAKPPEQYRQVNSPAPDNDESPELTSLRTTSGFTAPLSTLSAEAQQQLKTILTQAVGPIATMLLNQALTEGLTCRQVLERLTRYIPPKSPFWVQIREILAQVKPTESQAGAAPLTTNRLHTSLGSEISAAFLERCKKELEQVIGPIASFLLQDLVSRNPHITQAQLIQALVEMIPDPRAAQQFQKRF
jgi:serine/threonine-protein kinase